MKMGMCTCVAWEMACPPIAQAWRKVWLRHCWVRLCSYFKSIGKAKVLNNFFQHASFIAGSNMPGSLQNTSQSNKEIDFLSFIRLVGTFYFKKHLNAFVALKGHKTPTHLYNSLEASLQPREKHEKWLQNIRELSSDRILNEEDRVPTFSSLWRHWQRSCWISQL